RANVEAAVSYARDHEHAARQPDRVDRLEMAVRLLRWLATPESEFSDFGTLARTYAREGGFVDLARFALLGGDDIARLSEAYSRLGALAGARRDDQNRRFAQALRTWNGTNDRGEALPIERGLEAVVAPLARQALVLL